MAKEENYGKFGYKKNWKKYILWYILIAIIVYLAIYFLYFKGSIPGY